MSGKLTRNDLKNSWYYGIVAQVGYCDLANLLAHDRPMGHNEGIYGWNWDAYDVDGVTIVTGYRNLTGIGLPRESYVDLEEEAKRVCRDGSLGHAEMMERLDALKRELAERVRYIDFAAEAERRAKEA